MTREAGGRRLAGFGTGRRATRRQMIKIDHRGGSCHRDGERRQSQDGQHQPCPARHLMEPDALAQRKGLAGSPVLVLRRDADVDDEYFELVGAKLEGLHVHLALVRGEYKPKERPLDRGIGTIAYSPFREADVDTPPMNAMLHGWWWMPEPIYDEVWRQASLETWHDCRVEIEIAPVTFDVMTFKWDVETRKVLHILRASAAFHRAKPAPADQEQRRRGLFGRALAT